MSQRQLSDLNISQANKILCRKHLIINKLEHILNYINKIRRYLKVYIWAIHTQPVPFNSCSHTKQYRLFFGSSSRRSKSALSGEGHPRYAYAHPQSCVPSCLYPVDTPYWMRFVRRTDRTARENFSLTNWFFHVFSFQKMNIVTLLGFKKNRVSDQQASVTPL